MPRPPAFETAAASSGVAAEPIGAWMTGTAIPSRSHKGVVMLTPVSEPSFRCARPAAGYYRRSNAGHIRAAF